MDKKRLTEPVVSEVNDNTTPKTTAQTDYGTSPLELQETEQAPIEFLSCRRILYMMMFLGFAVAYCLRVSLSEAIVAMVNQTAVGEGTVTGANTSDTSQCRRDPQLQRGDGQLVWDRHEQGTVLAAFYYGYLCTQVSSTNFMHALYQHATCTEVQLSSVYTCNRLYNRLCNGFDELCK